MKLDENTLQEILNSNLTKKVISLNELITKKHRTMYYKWVIKGDVSVRYHEIFQDKSDLVGEFILKDHASGNWSKINKVVAQSIISGPDVEEPVKIIGYTEGNDYIKIIEDNDGNQTFRNEKNTDDEDAERLWSHYWILEKNKYVRQIDKFRFVVSYEPDVDKFILLINNTKESTAQTFEDTYDKILSYTQQYSAVKNKRLFFPPENVIYSSAVL